MKTITKIFLLLMMMISCASIKAQQWATAGNVLGGGEILGATTGPFPLTIQTAP
jgi:hypothetical protein